MSPERREGIVNTFYPTEKQGLTSLGFQLAKMTDLYGWRPSSAHARLWGNSGYA